MNFEYKDYELSNAITDIAAGPFGSNLKVSCFTTTGFPIIDGANLKEITVTDNITKFVPEDKARSLHRSIAKRRDVVVTISGNVGQVSYIPDNSQYAEYLCSQRQFRVTIDESKIYVPYLVYYLHSVEGQSKILAFANQTGVPALSQPLKNFRKIKIDLPSLAEQKKIATILSALDEKIAINRAINDNLEQQAMALYRQMFVETNNDARRECRADEYFDISIGKTPPRKEAQWFSMNPIDCIWVSISDMGRCGMYIADSSEYLTHESVDKFNIKVVPDNTVLLSFKLTVGRVAITDGAMATNEAIAHFKTDKPEINEYLYCYLKDFNYQTMGSTSSIATAVNSKIIKAMPFVAPTDAELVTFHSATAPMFEMIKTRQRENTRLAELRDSLLPKLMSGEIDVSAVQL